MAKLQAAQTANLAQGTIDLVAEGSEILADFQKKVQDLAEKPEPVVKCEFSLNFPVATATARTD